mgnify:CR=1 FL=1
MGFSKVFIKLSADGDLEPPSWWEAKVRSVKGEFVNLQFLDAAATKEAKRSDERLGKQVKFWHDELKGVIHIKASFYYGRVLDVRVETDGAKLYLVEEEDQESGKKKERHWYNLDAMQALGQVKHKSKMMDRVIWGWKHSTIPPPPAPPPKRARQDEAGPSAVYRSLGASAPADNCIEQTGPTGAAERCCHSLVVTVEVFEPAWTRGWTNAQGEFEVDQARLDNRFCGPPSDPLVYGDVVVTHPESSAWFHTAADGDGAAAVCPLADMERDAGTVTLLGTATLAIAGSATGAVPTGPPPEVRPDAVRAIPPRLAALSLVKTT